MDGDLAEALGGVLQLGSGLRVDEVGRGHIGQCLRGNEVVVLQCAGSVAVEI